MNGERITPLVDLRNIDRVPVSLVHPVFDRLCPVPLAEYTYSQIASYEKYMRYEHGNHLIFGLAATKDAVDRMVQTIETGTADENHTSLAFLGLTNIFENLFMMFLDFMLSASPLYY